MTKKELLALKAVVYGCNTNKKCANAEFATFDKGQYKEGIEFKEALKIMYEFIDNEETNSIKETKNTNKELERELAIKKDQCFVLYCVLYEQLEKDNIENVASMIEYLTGGFNFADECESLKRIMNKMRGMKRIKKQLENME